VLLSCDANADAMHQIKRCSPLLVVNLWCRRNAARNNNEEDPVASSARLVAAPQRSSQPTNGWCHASKRRCRRVSNVTDLLPRLLLAGPEETAAATCAPRWRGPAAGSIAGMETPPDSRDTDGVARGKERIAACCLNS
jgi:hypothetical protein